MPPQLPRETPRRFEPARPLLIEGRSVSRTRSPFFTPVHRVSRWDGFRPARHAAFAARQRCEGDQLLLPYTSKRAPVPRAFPNCRSGDLGVSRRQDHFGGPVGFRRWAFSSQRLPYATEPLTLPRRMTCATRATPLPPPGRETERRSRDPKRLPPVGTLHKRAFIDHRSAT